MLRRAALWEQKRRKLTERKVVIRLDACKVAALPTGGYGVTIDGFNLHRAISPPRISVGGIELADLQFARNGRQIHGVLARKPSDTRLVVDYGFARAELGPTR